MNINHINQTLDHSIKSAAEKAVRGQPSRRRKLSVADTIRLLIGAEGGSLDRILHTAGIEVTASAVSQRRAQIDPAVFRAVFDRFNFDCSDADNALFRGYHLLAADGTAVNLPRNPTSVSFVCNDGIPNGVNQLHLTPLCDLLKFQHIWSMHQKLLKNQQVRDMTIKKRESLFLQIFPRNALAISSMIG